MPDSVSEPLVNTKFPFAPLITPANVPLALEIVRVWLPKITDPAEVPVRLVMVAPEVVPLISNAVLSTTLDDDAIEPVPVNANVPALMVVEPVYWLILVNVN